MVLLYLLFAISGFAALIYESVWSHYLALLLGHSANAQSLVLVIFMGGIAAGSWIASRFSDRVKYPLKIYALIEIAVGLVAVVFHGVFDFSFNFFLESIVPVYGDSLVTETIATLIAATLIAPQSILLGATFPLMSASVVRVASGDAGSRIAVLYFVNSAGAAIGVLASAFWLIRMVGLPGAILTAGLLNIFVGFAVWMAYTSRDSTGKQGSPALPAPNRSRNLQVLVVTAAFVSGMASFIYEISWVRMLSHVLGGTTHSFELMISAFISGLALGGLWIRRVVDRTPSPIQYAGVVQILMGLCALATVPVFLASFDWMSSILSHARSTGSEYWSFAASTHLIALAVMLPATFFAGMTLPLFTAILFHDGQGERCIGRIYAANTIGAIVGVLFAVHVGMPALGMKQLIVLGAVLDILLGFVFLMRQPLSRYRTIATSLGCVVLIAMIASIRIDYRIVSSGVFRHGDAKSLEQAKIRYSKDGRSSSVLLVEHPDGILSLSINGKPEAALQQFDAEPIALDEVTMTLLGALPMSFNPAATSVVNVGFGSGLTSHVLLGNEDIHAVTTIEIEPAVVEAARFFGDKVDRAYRDARSRIQIDDAKIYFARNELEHDIIIAEPSNPWVRGVAGLFSTEFYALVRRNLAEDGIFAQWIQLYEFDNELVVSILKSISENFDDYAVFTMDTGNILVIARNRGALGDPQWLPVFDANLAGNLSRIHVNSLEDINVRLLLAKSKADPILNSANIPANSVYFPFVDQRAAEARFNGRTADLFLTLQLAPQPLVEMLNDEVVQFSELTDSNYVDRVRNIVGARAVLIGNAITGTGIERNASNHPLYIDLVDQYTWVFSSGETCEKSIDTGAWKMAVLDIAEKSLPYLSPHDGIAVIDSLRNSSCRPASDDDEAFELYVAIAGRDPDAIISRSVDALEGDFSAASPAHARYALSAGLLGAISAGRYDFARYLITTYWRPTFLDQPVPLYVALLAAMANDTQLAPRDSNQSQAERVNTAD